MMRFERPAGSHLMVKARSLRLVMAEGAVRAIMTRHAGVFHALRDWRSGERRAGGRVCMTTIARVAAVTLGASNTKRTRVIVMVKRDDGRRSVSRGVNNSVHARRRRTHTSDDLGRTRLLFNKRAHASVRFGRVAGAAGRFIAPLAVATEALPVISASQAGHGVIVVRTRGAMARSAGRVSCGLNRMMMTRRAAGRHLRHFSVDLVVERHRLVQIFQVGQHHDVRG